MKILGLESRKRWNIEKFMIEVKGKKKLVKKVMIIGWVGPGGVERCDVEGPGRLVDYAVKEKKKML